MPGLRPVNMPMKPEDAAKIIPKAELDKLPQSVLGPIGGGSQGLGSVGGSGGAGFQGLFGNLINEVSAKQSAAGEAMKEVMTGGGLPLHQAMIAVEEASVSFQLMVEVRNRLLESYQELMRMQV